MGRAGPVILAIVDTHQSSFLRGIWYFLQQFIPLSRGFRGRVQRMLLNINGVLRIPTPTFLGMSIAASEDGGRVQLPDAENGLPEFIAPRLCRLDI